MSFRQPGRRRDYAAASLAPRSLDLDAIEARIAANLPVLDALSAARHRRSGALVPASSSGLRLLAQGDSWFDHRPTDLADGLRRHGGHTVTSLALSGSTLDHVVHGSLPQGHLGVADAHQVSRAEDLVYAMQSLQPDALVFSAGGNDVKGGALGLVGSALTSPTGLDVGRVQRHVTDVVSAPYRELIALVTAKAQRMGRRVPIVIHGYDYPWVSERARWVAAQLGRGAGELLDTVGRAFIDGFDGALSELAAEHPGTVFLADLRGTLTDAAGWADEIHPSARGFDQLAAQLDRVVRAALAPESKSDPAVPQS